MSNGTDQGLTGQQLQQMQKRLAEVLQGIRDGIELRKQCLEMAIRAAPHTAEPDEVMALAQKMFGFLTAETVDVHVTINPP